MPFGLKPQCTKCETDESEIWHKSSDGKAECNQCHITISIGPQSQQFENVKILEKTNVIVSTVVPDTIGDSFEVEMDVIAENENTDGGKSGPGTRSGSSTNSRGGKAFKKSGRGRSRKIGNGSKVPVSKGRGRRAIFKKQPMKAPSSVATVVTSDSLFHQGIYYQVGDIVSLMDEDDGIYYAQIRGLLQDQYCEKSAVITWLLPTQNSPPPEKGFDPHTYILGPEEDLPRKLEYLEFVMHAPNEYFKLDVNVRPADEKEAGFIWTSIGPVRRTIQT